MKGIGVDIVSISRIESILSGDAGRAFQNKVFTKREQEYAADHSDPLRYWASRFAGKEAVFKAFKTEWEPADLETDIEILGAGNKPVKVEVHGRFQQLLRECRGEIQLSLSYEDDYAIAFALIDQTFK